MTYSTWQSDVRIGIESEALRMDTNRSLSSTPHPFEETSQSFTKDFAESQLEMITSPSPGPFHALFEIERLAKTACSTLDHRNEVLWPLSMPPALPDESNIHLARFDKSEKGRRKYLYRKGLASRFGKARQLICGVHINISMGDRLLAQLVSDAGATGNRLYLRASRYLYRHLESLILLSGCSPVAGQGFPFSQFNRQPIISVRNSREGYAADRLFAKYLDLSSIANYIVQLRKGLHTALPAYLSKGLVKNGRLLQLSGNVFQSEQEFYAPIRLRQITEPGESQTQALEKRGVGYLELRFIDRNPFQPGGIDQDTLLLVHLFFLQGLLDSESHWSDATRDGYLEDAQAAAETRLIDIIENRSDTSKLLTRTQHALISLRQLAGILDRNLCTENYTRMLERQYQRLKRPEHLLSAALFRQYRASGLSWTDFGLSMMPHDEKEFSREIYYAGV